MSKILFSLFIMMFSTAFLFSQSFNGKVILGGTLSYRDETVPQEQPSPQEAYAVENNTFTISSYIGLFVNDNALLGIGIGYEKTNYKLINSKYDDIDISEKNFRITTFELFARYYSNLGNDFSFFPELKFSFGIGKEDEKFLRFQYANNSRKEDIVQFKFILTPGFSYKINDWIIAEALIGQIYYSNTKTEIETRDRGDLWTTDYNNNNYGFEIDLTNIRLGINLLL